MIAKAIFQDKKTTNPFDKIIPKINVNIENPTAT
jgi:ABC-type sulfate transport system substrate-binding protein